MKLGTTRLLLAVAATGTWLMGESVSFAQRDQDVLLDGVPIENAIVGRDIAVRVRGEARFEDDYDGLIDRDVNYSRFPSRVYSTDVTAFRKDRSYIGFVYSRWENDQDLSIARWSGKFRTPIHPDSDTFLYLQFESDETRDGPSYNYGSVGVDRSITEDLYAYFTYRFYHTAGRQTTHQLSAYMSWKPSSLMRVGGEVAGSMAEDVPGLAPWYTRLFGVMFIVPEYTSVRLEGMHYDTGTDFSSDTLSAYLYQRIGNSSFLRFDYRYYADNQDLYSSAWGIKGRHYFTPAVSAHAGYRWYEHSEGTDFSGPYAGIDLLF